MAELTQLDAESRERAGKGAARATRRAGRVPAVIYGDKQDPVMISIDPGFLAREMRKPGFFGTQYGVQVDGGTHRVLPRDVQFHPVTDAPMHVDFLRVTDETRIKVSVPVRFVNEEDSPGLKRGGVINVVRHEVEVICAVGSIPDQLIADLGGLEIGDSIHISAIDLGEGVEPTITDRDFTVASVAAPTVVSEEAAAEAAEAEELEGIEAEEAAEAAEAEAEAAEAPAAAEGKGEES